MAGYWVKARELSVALNRPLLQNSACRTLPQIKPELVNCQTLSDIVELAFGDRKGNKGLKEFGEFDLYSLFRHAQKQGHLETTGMLVSDCTEKGGNSK